MEELFYYVFFKVVREYGIFFVGFIDGLLIVVLFYLFDIDMEVMVEFLMILYVKLVLVLFEFIVKWIEMFY